MSGKFESNSKEENWAARLKCRFWEQLFRNARATATCFKLLLNIFQEIAISICFICLLHKQWFYHLFLAVENWKQKMFNVFASIVVLGFFILVGVGIYTNKHTIHNAKEWNFSWSFALGWVSCLFTFIAGIFAFFGDVKYEKL